MKFLKKIDKSELMGKVTRAASKYGYKLKKASPTIMMETTHTPSRRRIF